MKLSDLAKRMIFTILIIMLMSVLSSVIYYRSLGFLPFMLGALIGSAVSVIKTLMLERAVDKAMDMEQKQAKSYVGLQHILRLALSGAALVLGALVPQISLWGVAVGVLSFQLAVYSLKFKSKKTTD